MFGTRRIFIFLTVSLANGCLYLTLSLSLPLSLPLSHWHPLPLGNVLHNQFLINSNHPTSHKYRIRRLLCGKIYVSVASRGGNMNTFLIWIFLRLHYPTLPFQPLPCCRKTLSLAAKTMQPATHSQQFRPRRRSVLVAVSVSCQEIRSPM